MVPIIGVDNDDDGNVDNDDDVYDNPDYVPHADNVPKPASIPTTHICDIIIYAETNSAAVARPSPCWAKFVKTLRNTGMNIKESPISNWLSYHIIHPFTIV